jgi:hypothetical protein
MLSAGLSSKADVSAVALNPVYGENGEVYLYSGLPEGAELTDGGPKWTDGDWVFGFTYEGGKYWGLIHAGEDDFPLMFTCFYNSLPGEQQRDPINVEISRNSNSVVGYVLGDQTDKPLQPSGNYATSSYVDESCSELSSELTGWVEGQNYLTEH